MKYLKSFEGIRIGNIDNFKGTDYYWNKIYQPRPTHINSELKEDIEYRLMPITDIIDKDGKKYDIRVSYFAPTMGFSGEISNQIISMDITKGGKEFDIIDVHDTLLELISQLKNEYGYIFTHYNLKNKLNQVISKLDDPRIYVIEEGFKNLLKREEYQTAKGLYLSFVKEYKPIQKEN